MGAWSCDFEFYFSPVMFRIKKTGSNRAGHELLREAILFRLLTFCARGDTFRDVKQFSKMAEVPLNQAQMVWDVCVEEGILRQAEHGYSTRVWMGENEMMPMSIKTTPRKNKTEKSQTETTTPTVIFESSEKIELPKREVSVKKDPPKNNPLNRPIDEIKEYVRPNVRLTRSEITKLKESFTDDEISRMLDLLSEYKMNSGKTYPSDYDAINRWVLKRIFEEKQAGKFNKPKFEAEELPDWVYGKAK